MCAMRICLTSWTFRRRSRGDRDASLRACASVGPCVVLSTMVFGERDLMHAWGIVPPPIREASSCIAIRRTLHRPPTHRSVPSISLEARWTRSNPSTGRMDQWKRADAHGFDRHVASSSKQDRMAPSFPTCQTHTKRPGCAPLAVRRRLTAGQGTLDPLIVVRIHASEPFVEAGQPQLS